MGYQIRRGLGVGIWLYQAVMELGAQFSLIDRRPLDHWEVAVLCSFIAFMSWDWIKP